MPPRAAGPRGARAPPGALRSARASALRARAAPAARGAGPGAGRCAPGPEPRPAPRSAGPMATPGELASGRGREGGGSPGPSFSEEELAAFAPLFGPSGSSDSWKRPTRSTALPVLILYLILRHARAARPMKRKRLVASSLSLDISTTAPSRQVMPESPCLTASTHASSPRDFSKLHHCLASGQVAWLSCWS